MAAFDPDRSTYESERTRGIDPDSSYTRPVTPTLDEIRYAEQLRLQLREAYLRRPVFPPHRWCISAD
jgi:hypothetical protein